MTNTKKAAPIRSRLSEQFTCRAKNESEQGNYINRVTKLHNCRITGKTKATGGGRQWENTKHKPGHHSDLLAGGQCDQCAGLLVGCQPGGRFLFAFKRRGYFSTKGSRANLSGTLRFSVRVNALFISLRVFSRWRMIIDNALFCSSWLFIIITFKTMRRSTSHHGADSDYSDSLALRRWRRLISPCIDVMMNCDVLSPDSFTDSMAFTISCGTRAFRACDFAFVVPVAISIPLVDWWGTVYTEKAQIKLLTWATPKTYSGPHLKIIKAHKSKAPQVSLPLAGLLTTNRYER